MIKITDVQAIPLRGTRDYAVSAGLKTSAEQKAPVKPKALTGDYASRRHICIYPQGYQTTLVRIRTDAGITGIGESHAPIAPQVSKAIIDGVLSRELIGQDPRKVDVLWEKMYSTMRLRGHSTGYMMEAIAGVDIALWDIFGKSVDLPVYALLGGAFRERIAAYASGVPGATPAQQAANAARFVHEQGFTAVKMSTGRRSLEEELAFVRAISIELSRSASKLMATSN